jgi:S-adenosylmethionine synthetase
VKGDDMGRMIFTSESVTEGHPDKMCDQISDAILDACLKQDPNSRVACETAIKNSTVWVLGEITTKAVVNYAEVVKDTVKNIGYNDPDFGICSDTFTSMISLSQQSPEISQGVTEGEGLHKAQGAGDQGLMFGYACLETKELMPLPIMLAHKLTQKLADVRKSSEAVEENILGPDGKSQVSIVYENGRPQYASAIVVSTQHKERVSHEELYSFVLSTVINPVCEDYITKDTKIYVNPTGKFVIGGPIGDAGLTGRKIIVDTYGGMGRHGGGAFSGKDSSKVDRSAAYMARYIAKNLVIAGAADRCEVQLAYAIGVAEPVSILVDSFDTGRVPPEFMEKIVREVFDLTPEGIIDALGLKRPIFQETAAYGHFGRKGFPWENTDKKNEITKLIESYHESN